MKEQLTSHILGLSASYHDSATPRWPPLDSTPWNSPPAREIPVTPGLLPPG